jgi:hypothetical protein
VPTLWRACIEGVHPTTVGRWVNRAYLQAKAADHEVITGVSTQNIELDELYSFGRRPTHTRVSDEIGGVGSQSVTRWVVFGVAELIPLKQVSTCWKRR